MITLYPPRGMSNAVQGIELLLEAGAKPAVRNLAGWTAADWAYSAKLYEILTSGTYTRQKRLNSF